MLQVGDEAWQNRSMKDWGASFWAQLLGCRSLPKLNRHLELEGKTSQDRQDVRNVKEDVGCLVQNFKEHRIKPRDRIK